MSSEKDSKKTVGAMLFSVIESLPEKDKAKLREVINQISEKSKMAFANLGTLTTFLNRVKDQTSPKEKSLLDLFTYLILIEGPFDLTMDVILAALIFAGHDLYVTRDRKYASPSFEDLENVDLWMKQSFFHVSAVRV